MSGFKVSKKENRFLPNNKIMQLTKIIFKSFCLSSFIFIFSSCSSSFGSFGSDPSDAQIEDESETMFHFLRGQLLINDANLDEAIKNLEVACELSGQNEPDLFYQLAQLYFVEKRFDDALLTIEKALKIVPKNTNYRLFQAGVFEHINRKFDAIKIFREIIEDSPDTLDSYLLLSSLYLNQKNYNEAISVLNGLAKNEKYGDLAHYYLGHAYELTGDLEKAEEEYLYAFKKSTNNIQIITDIVRIYMTANRYDDAIKICRDVIKKNPFQIEAQRSLVQVLLAKKQYDEAITELRILSKQEENPNVSRIKIALIYVQQGKLKEAQNELKTLLEHDSQSDEARYYLAFSYVLSNQVDEALPLLMEITEPKDLFVKSRAYATLLYEQSGDVERAISTAKEGFYADPTDKKMLTALLALLVTNNKNEDAIEIIKKGLEIDREDPTLLFQYGVCLSNLGKSEEAVDKMLEVLEIQPDNADALNFVAYSYAEADKKLSTALEMSKKAIQLKPDDGFLIDTLGWIYFKQNCLKDAERELKKATTLVATDPILFEHYGDVLLKLKRVEEAMSMYEKSLSLEHKTEEDKLSKERVEKKINFCGNRSEK